MNQVCPKHSDALFPSNKNAITKKCTNLIDEHYRTSKDLQTIGWVELLFLFLMQHPELIASTPRLRQVFENKLKTFRNELNGSFRNTFHSSTIILNDGPIFLRQIRNNPHYVDIPTAPQIPNVYRLRPRKKINYAE
jgi:hypothetical protein